MAEKIPPVLVVSFYRTSLGREPVREWLRGLSPEVRKIIGEDIKTVQFGWPLGMPLVRKLKPNLWEVRITLPQGIARVLFTTYGKFMVLVHGIIKKSQKIPPDDLDLAERRTKEIQNG